MRRREMKYRDIIKTVGRTAEEKNKFSLYNNSNSDMLCRQQQQPLKWMMRDPLPAKRFSTCNDLPIKLPIFLESY